MTNSSLIIQAPRLSRTTLLKGTARRLANAAAQEILIAHWQGIVKSLGNFLSILKANHVRIAFAASLFGVLSFILFLVQLQVGMILLYYSVDVVFFFYFYLGLNTQP